MIRCLTASQSLYTTALATPALGHAQHSTVVNALAAKGARRPLRKFKSTISTTSPALRTRAVLGLFPFKPELALNTLASAYTTAFSANASSASAHDANTYAQNAASAPVTAPDRQNPPNANTKNTLDRANTGAANSATASRTVEPSTLNPPARTVCGTTSASIASASMIGTSDGVRFNTSRSIFPVFAALSLSSPSPSSPSRTAARAIRAATSPVSSIAATSRNVSAAGTMTCWHQAIALWSALTFELAPGMLPAVV
mmetsp:Transcript_1687/g.7512  ORF Transcript_1687/g.7512 Transcript_1687/m.7512 type:complete len:257 (-) Transcript_1687:924-1694(-)